jgi:TolA-binding protein
MGTGVWRVTASKKGYNSSSIDINVKQLTRNPALSITLKRMTGLAGLAADDASSGMFDRGNSLVNEGKYDEASAIFEEFMKKIPGDISSSSEHRFLLS